MAEEKDLYKILGVDRNATKEDIKKGYRKMAAKHHPDRNPGDEAAQERFKEVKRAYDILSDDQRRAIYDRHGYDAAAGTGGGPGGFGFGFGNGGFDDTLSDIFSSIFSGGGRSQSGRSGRGRDLAYEIELSLEEAVSGCDKPVRISASATCETCHGSGATEASKQHTCKMCNGQGQVRMQQAFFSIAQTCPQCHGSGKVIENPCKDCHGEGRVNKQRTITVSIPAGVDSGNRVRISGEGEAGMNGAPAGDLFIEIRVRQHPIFTREGDDLHCVIPMSFVTACLGGKIEVPTLTGRVLLDIPAETQTGKTFCLRGKGIRSVHSRSEGDLYCTVNIETPVNLNSEQKELLERFGATINEGGARHVPKETSFWDTLKGFFNS